MIMAKLAQTVRRGSHDERSWPQEGENSFEPLIDTARSEACDHRKARAGRGGRPVGGGEQPGNEVSKAHRMEQIATGSRVNRIVL
jgi:hypothetical protein